MSTALNCQHCFRYVQETLISFPLILFALCLLCMRMIRLDTLDGSSWHIYFLDRMWVSLQNPLIWCNEVTSRRTCTALLSSALRAFLRWISKCIHYRILIPFATNVVYSHIFGHASLTTIRRDFGHEFTECKFPNPPKFVVDLPQSVLECGFNAQRCVCFFGSISYACKTARCWQSCVILPFFGERLPTDVWWTTCKFLPPFPWDISLLV